MPDGGDVLATDIRPPANAAPARGISPARRRADDPDGDRRMEAGRRRPSRLHRHAAEGLDAGSSNIRSMSRAAARCSTPVSRTACAASSSLRQARPTAITPTIRCRCGRRIRCAAMRNSPMRITSAWSRKCWPKPAGTTRTWSRSCCASARCWARASRTRSRRCSVARPAWRSRLRQPLRFHLDPRSRPHPAARRDRRSARHLQCRRRRRARHARSRRRAWQARALAVAGALLKLALGIAHPLGLSRYGPEQVRFLQFRPVLDNTRLKTEFGYVPEKTSAEVFDLWRKGAGL
jgi:hypothetical protein